MADLVYKYRTTIPSFYAYEIYSRPTSYVGVDALIINNHPVSTLDWSNVLERRSSGWIQILLDERYQKEGQISKESYSDDSHHHIKNLRFESAFTGLFEKKLTIHKTKRMQNFQSLYEGRTPAPYCVRSLELCCDETKNQKVSSINMSRLACRLAKNYGRLPVRAGLLLHGHQRLADIIHWYPDRASKVIIYKRPRNFDKNVSITLPVCKWRFLWHSFGWNGVCPPGFDPV